MTDRNKALFAEHADLAAILERARLLATDFHAGLAERPVAAAARTAPGLPLPERGLGALRALDLFERQVAPNLSGGVGPRYLGYVTGGATPAALVGDWLAAAVDQNPASPGDSIAPALIEETVAMMAALFDLPTGPGGFDGCFTTGALGANLLGAASFREWAGRRSGVDVTETGVAALSGLQVFTASPHITMLKVMGLLGLGRSSLMQIGRLPGREAMDVAALEAALAASDARSKVVVASAGIVSTGDFEDLNAIADICEKHDAWLHVDGAFGLFARCSRRFADLAAGVERADSITTDGHKWLNVPYDCGLFLTRHMDLLEASMRLTAAYLETDDPAPSYINRGVESSSRFRALPVWMALQAYGRDGVREMVETSCDLAASLGRRIEAMDGFELLAPVRLNIVLFRGLLGDDAASDQGQRHLMNAINATGNVYLTPGVIGGRAGMRAAFSNWMTTEQDVAIVADALALGRAALLAERD